MTSTRIVRLTATILAVFALLLTILALLDPEFWGPDAWIFPACLIAAILALIFFRPNGGNRA